MGTTVIVGSTFSGNSGQQRRGRRQLGDVLTIVNSTFDGNAATGTDGNPGNGGNGGAVVFDGSMTTESLCGSTFTHNTAGAQGGAIFRVAYTGEPTIIDQCTFDGNSADPKVGLAGRDLPGGHHHHHDGDDDLQQQGQLRGRLLGGRDGGRQPDQRDRRDNSSNQGGGFWFANPKGGTFLNCTIAGNTSGYGGTLFAGSNTIVLQNSIVAGGGSARTAASCSRAAA